MEKRKDSETASVLDFMMWDIGRSHYAYVGLAERLLEEAGLDTIRTGMGLILFSLYEQDGRTVKEIAARSQFAHSTLSGLLARMEKVGLIRRTRDEEDARLVRVRLTPQAKSLENQCRALAKQINDLIVAGLGENIAQAQVILRQLVETLRTEEEKITRSGKPPA